MASTCTLCCHPVHPVKSQVSTLDSRLFISLCKTLKICGPSSFQTSISLTENPVCSSCLDLLKTADDTLMKLEELELKIAKIADELQRILKRGYSALKESWEIPEHEFEYVPTDVQKFLLKAVGVDTDEDYIEVVPLSHDEFKRYEEVYEEDAFSPLDEGVFNEDRDDLVLIGTENSEEIIQHQESKAPGRSSEPISGCGSIKKLESPIKELSSRKRKRKCDQTLISDTIEGVEWLVESGMETATSEVRRKHRVAGTKPSRRIPRKKKPNVWYCFYDGCRKRFKSMKAVRAHMLKPHDVETVNENLEFNCKRCGQCFHNYVFMINHFTCEHAAEANPHLVPLFCQRCGKDFGSVKALKAHMKDHPSQKHLNTQQRPSHYSCFYDGCREVHDNVVALRAHLLKPHEVEVVNQSIEFGCNKCDQSFSTYMDVSKHLATVHDPGLVRLFCQKCGYACAGVFTLKAHMKDHRSDTVGPLSCKNCGKSFIKEHFRRRHEPVCGKTKWKGLLSCRICRRTFLARCIYKKHKMGFNQCILTMEKECRSFFCRGCGRSFSLRRRHIRHNQRCRKCPRRKSCSYIGCTEGFVGNLMNDMHLREPHKVDMPENRKNPYFNCDVCKRIFTSYESVNEHIRTDHPSDVMKTRPLCQICGKFYKDVSRLQAHLKYHAGHMFICETCGKSFASKSILNVHIRGSHHSSKNDKDYNRICKGCSKSFKYERAWQNHQKVGCTAVHSCRFCGKEFSSSYLLRYHENRHEKPRITCEICKKRFITPTELVRHRRIHFPEQRVSCHLCPATYARVRSLNNHINLKHLGKARHKCEQCGYICGDRVNLEIHIRKHTGEKPFMCDICGMTFRSKPLMNNHRKIFHMDKPHKCEICGHAFVHRYRYERHMRTHTNPQLHWKVRQKLAREAAKKAQNDGNV